MPGNTPPGLYDVASNVGTFPNAVLASDTFPITVTAERLAGGPAAEPFAVERMPGDLFAARSALGGDGSARAPGVAASASGRIGAAS